MDLLDKITFTFDLMRSEGEHKQCILFLYPLEELGMCYKRND